MVRVDQADGARCLFELDRSGTTAEINFIALPKPKIAPGRVCKESSDFRRIQIPRQSYHHNSQHLGNRLTGQIALFRHLVPFSSS